MVFKGLGREAFLNSTEEKCHRCNGWGTEDRGYRKQNGEWQHMSLICSVCHGKKVIVKT